MNTNKPLYVVALIITVVTGAFSFAQSKQELIPTFHQLLLANKISKTISTNENNYSKKENILNEYIQTHTDIKNIQVKIISCASISATATPPNRILISYKLINALRTDEEIYAILTYLDEKLKTKTTLKILNARFGYDILTKALNNKDEKITAFIVDSAMETMREGYTKAMVESIIEKTVIRLAINEMNPIALNTAIHVLEKQNKRESYFLGRTNIAHAKEFILKKTKDIEKQYPRIGRNDLPRRELLDKLSK